MTVAARRRDDDAHFFPPGHSPMVFPRHKMGKEMKQFANKEGERTT